MMKSGMDNDVNRALVDMLETQNNLEWDDLDGGQESYSSDEEGGGLSHAASSAWLSGLDGDDSEEGGAEAAARRATKGSQRARRGSQLGSRRSSSLYQDASREEGGEEGGSLLGIVLPMAPSSTRTGAYSRRRSMEMSARHRSVSGAVAGSSREHSSEPLALSTTVCDSAPISFPTMASTVGEGSAPSAQGSLAAAAPRHQPSSSSLLGSITGGAWGVDGTARHHTRRTSADGPARHHTRRTSTLDMGLKPGQMPHDLDHGEIGADSSSDLHLTLSPQAMLSTSRSGPLPFLPSPTAPSVCPYRGPDGVITPPEGAGSSAQRWPHGASVTTRSPSPAPGNLMRLLLEPLPTPPVLSLNRTHSGVPPIRAHSRLDSPPPECTPALSPWFLASSSAHSPPPSPPAVELINKGTAAQASALLLADQATASALVPTKRSLPPCRTSFAKVLPQVDRSSDAGGLHHEARARIVGLMRLADASRGADNLLTLQLWEQGGSSEGTAASTSGAMQLAKAPNDEVSHITA